MAVTYDNSNKGTETVASGNTLTVSLNIANQSNRYLFAFLSYAANTGGLISGITHNGDALTKIGSYSGGVNVRTTEIWYIANPDNGTYNTVATVNGTLESKLNMTIISVYDCGGYELAGSYAQSSRSPSKTLTTTKANGLILCADCVYEGGGGNDCTNKTTDGQVAILNDELLSFVGTTCGVGRQPTTTAGNYTFGFDAIYAYNEGGSYSIMTYLHATTPVVAPTVTTQAGDLATMNSIRGNGNITNNGGGTITEKGICYILGTSGDPTTADSTVHDHTDSTGAFTEIITGLLTGRAYRFRAYAINSAGTGYGDTVQVYTLTNFLQMFQ